MKKEKAKQFWSTYIGFIKKDGLKMKLGNPGTVFIQQAKAGEFDDLTDEQYNDMLEEIRQTSSLWDGLPSDTVGNLFLKALNRTPLGFREINLLSDILASASENVDYSLVGEDASNSSQNMTKENCHKRHGANKKYGGNKKHSANRDKWAWTPQEIYDYLESRIYGQAEAKRAAAMLIYNHLHRSRRNIVMAGATGCGKTEIWRTLSEKFRFIKIVNGPQLACDGWKGSYHIKDIFFSAPEMAESLVIVIDEADKLFEPTIGNGGTDFSYKLQNELLKIMDGDTITFVDDQNHQSLTVDCSNVSIVFCGSFETMMREKNASSVTLGFGGNVLRRESQMNECTEEDLVAYAHMRREIAGRIQKIVTLNKLTANDYEEIMKGKMSPITKVESAQKVSITVDDETRRIWAEEAVKSGLGCRYIRSKLQSRLDDLIFESPDKKEFVISASE